MTNKDIWLYLKSKNSGGGGESTNLLTVFNAIVKNNEITITGLVDDKLAVVDIPSRIANVPVTSVGNRAFQNCTNLTSLVIPEGVTTLGSDIVNGCSNLTELYLPSTLTTIAYNAFYNGGKVEHLEFFGDVDISQYITTLKTIVLKQGTVSIKIGKFANCGTLQSIAIPDSVTNIDNNAFSNCSALTSVSIPNSVTNIGNSAFYKCSSLTFINVPNSVTNIGNEAFSGCTSLTNITLQGNVAEIKNSMFRNCTNLTSLVIPEGVTTLGSDIVNGCSNLTELYLPSTLTTIAYNAFYNINNALEVVRLGDNFNYNTLNVSFSNRYSNEVIINMLNALADRTGETAYTLTLGATNLNKLTDEQKAIAINKNWTLA